MNSADATTPPAPPTRPATLDAALRVLAPALVGILVLCLAAFSPSTLNDGDTFSHVRTGLWILGHGTIPHVDVFSHTVRGAPWTAHEWLSELAMALAWRGGGWAGVTALTAACAASAAFLLTRAVARRLDGTALVATSLVGLIGVAPALLARPHILALPILVLWMDEILEARRSGRAPGKLLLSGLMLLWANLHGGWAFGLAMLGLAAAERAASASGDLAARWRASRGWLVALALSSLAAVMTPNGVEGVLFPVRLSAMPLISAIGEWKAYDFTRISPLEIMLLAALGAGLSGRVRLDGFCIAVLLLLLHMALEHRRHELLLGVTGALMFAGGWQPARITTPTGRSATRIGTGLAVVATLTLVARLATPLPLAETAVTAPGALASVPAAVKARPVFNSYQFGGFLIFEGIAPYVDGRADMFGKAFLEDYLATTAPDPDRFRACVQRYRIGWALLRPTEPLAGMLEHEPGWRRIYSASNAVVFVRD